MGTPTDQRQLALVSLRCKPTQRTQGQANSRTWGTVPEGRDEVMEAASKCRPWEKQPEPIYMSRP